MDKFNKETSKFSAKTATVADAASDLLHEGKKFANEMYEEGKDKVHIAQQTAKEYTDEVLLKVQQNPLTSVLIAAGVGFLLSSLLRK